MAVKQPRPARTKSVFGAQARSVELLWGARERPGRGPKPSLTLDGIVAKTVALADAEGLGSISMQRVAAELGVTSMALYRYVPGKAELLDLVVDAALTSPPGFDGVGGGWREKTEAWAHALWKGFHRRPWTLEATSRLRHMGPRELEWLESGLTALAGCGLVGGELKNAFLLVNGHVRSFAQFSTKMTRPEASVSATAWSTAVETLLKRHGERYPAIVAAMQAGAFGPERADAFEFGLARVLDGIAAYVARRKRGR